MGATMRAGRPGLKQAAPEMTAGPATTPPASATLASISALTAGVADAPEGAEGTARVTPALAYTRRAKAPSRHDLPQAERRRRILDAAMRVIAVEGLSMTTIEKVARQAEVSPGTVIFHFHSKEELLLACLDTAAHEFSAAREAAIAAAEGVPELALEGLIEAVFDPEVASPEKVAVMYAFWSEAPTRRIYMERAGPGDRSYYNDIEGLFSELAREGRLAIEQGIAVRSFAGLLELLWQEILVDAERFDRRAAIRMARAHLASLLVRSRPDA